MLDNFNELTSFIVIALSVGCSALLVWWLRRWLLHRAVLDVPNERSSHSIPTPRGGGIAIVVVVLLGIGLVHALTPQHTLNGWRLLSYAIAALSIALISWRDDVRPLSSRVRFTVHLFAALVAVLALGWFESVHIFGFELRLGRLGLPFTLFWIVGLTNIYNFMDGIDGLAGGQAVVAGLGWVLLGLNFNNGLLLGIGLCVVGSSVGFLLFNWSPAKIFMGDVGSAFLGYLFATLPLLMQRTTPTPDGWWYYAFAGVAVFCWDATLTIMQRLRRRENIFKPHRSHLYQRLVRSGLSHAYVSSLYIVLMLVLVFGTLMLQLQWVWWFVYLLTGTSLIGYVHYVEAQRPNISENTTA